MNDTANKNEALHRLIQWAEAQASVRAMLLTSSRTSPNAPTDLFSDCDIILVVRDVHPFFEDRTRLEYFGKGLVVYRDPIQRDYGLENFGYITQYDYPHDLGRRMMAYLEKVKSPGQQADTVS